MSKKYFIRILGQFIFSGMGEYAKAVPKRHSNHTHKNCPQFLRTYFVSCGILCSPGNRMWNGARCLGCVSRSASGAEVVLRLVLCGAKMVDPLPPCLWVFVTIGRSGPWVRQLSDPELTLKGLKPQLKACAGSTATSRATLHAHFCVITCQLPPPGAFLILSLVFPLSLKLVNISFSLQMQKLKFR